MTNHRYSDFRDSIDIDAFEAAIGFEPLTTDKNNDTGYCVFPQNHKNGDSTGKFSIHREKMVYNCWVCGGGSLLSLAMELNNMGVEEATHWLRQFAMTDTRSDEDYQTYLLELLEDVEVRQATLPYFNPRVLERFDGPVDYFRTRGISDAIIDAYQLCYGANVMKPAPMKERNGKRVKIDDDYYGPAAIFPHFWQDRLVGWQHRWMDYPNTPKWLAKYTNTTDFPKSDTLFNYDIAVRTEGPVIVCESVPTVLFLASHGYSAVSYFGEVPKPAQLRLMRRFESVILAPDNDANGDKLLRVATKYLEPFIPVWHADKVEYGVGADLGDYASRKYAKSLIDLHMGQKVHPSFDVDAVL